MAQSKRKPQISTIERGHQTILMDGWDFSRVKFFVDYKIQTHKGLKRKLFIRTKHNMRFFGVTPPPPPPPPQITYAR